MALRNKEIQEMSNEKQQTAVEWFFDNLNNHQVQAEHFKIYQQAKEMEKEIIVNSYSKGYHDKDFSYFDLETFYNETYGGK